MRRKIVCIVRDLYTSGRASRATNWLVKINLFVENEFRLRVAGIPEPGQMGGSRAADACGMSKCLRFGHARYTQDSRSRREG